MLVPVKNGFLNSSYKKFSEQDPPIKNLGIKKKKDQKSLLTLDAIAHQEDMEERGFYHQDVGEYGDEIGGEDDIDYIEVQPKGKVKYHLPNKESKLKKKLNHNLSGGSAGIGSGSSNISNGLSSTSGHAFSGMSNNLFQINEVSHNEDINISHASSKITAKNTTVHT
jgi:hypothetical protein